jgi:hypothetical protein
VVRGEFGIAPARMLPPAQIATLVAVLIIPLSGTLTNISDVSESSSILSF